MEEIEQRDERLEDDNGFSAEKTENTVRAFPDRSKEKPSRQNKGVLVAVVTLLFFVGSLLGSLFTVYWLSYKPSFLPVPPIVKHIEPNGSGSIIEVKNPTTTTSEELIVQIAEKASQAVVKIEIYQTQNTRTGITDVLIGSGSGFVVSADGYIITNNHVVEKADTLDVIFKNGKKFNAKLIGADPISDIALIQIKANDLNYLSLANSDKVLVGQTVVAIGNPLGYDYSVTTGVVSGIQRDIDIPQSSSIPFDDFFDPFGFTPQQITTVRIPMVGIIQTDAAINKGNSGGPLINLNGEVIGVNFLIDAEGQGLGFAVSSNTVQKVKADLIEYGRVSWASLGITITTNSDAVAYKLDLKTNEGIVVMEVPPGNARDAGVKKNDVILNLDGKKMPTAEDAIIYIRSKNVGDKIKLTINRGGKTIEIEVELQELRRG